MKGNKGERRKNEWEISESETERLLTLGNEQEWWKRRLVEGWDDWVTGTEGDT